MGENRSMKESTIIKIVGFIGCFVLPWIMVKQNAVDAGNVYLVSLYIVAYFVYVIPSPFKVKD